MLSRSALVPNICIFPARSIHPYRPRKLRNQPIPRDVRECFWIYFADSLLIPINLATLPICTIPLLCYQPLKRKTYFVVLSWALNVGKERGCRMRVTSITVHLDSSQRNRTSSKWTLLMVHLSPPAWHLQCGEKKTVKVCKEGGFRYTLILEK